MCSCRIELGGESWGGSCWGVAERNIPTEVYHLPQKFGKQIRYAERKGIPYVWFPSMTEGEADQLRDIRSGAQVDVDAENWCPPEDDR